MDKPPKNRRHRWIIGSVLVAIVAGGLAWHFWRKREKPIVVQVEKVQRRDLTELVVASGRIQPVVQVVIQPEVSGEIVELPVVEGQAVKKGALLVRIKPDNYLAQRNSAQASHLSALANRNLARANLDKAKLEFHRIEMLAQNQLVSESQLLEAKTTLAVMEASFETSTHQADMAKAALARTEDDLAKTTIKAPTEGTVTKLRVQSGERVVGTAMMAGTEIMTIARLDEMEARVDLGEIDVVLIALGQKARLEVDSFRNRKFTGIVTEIANAAKTLSASTQQEATKFEVKIRIQEKEFFRPGMSVTAEVETRYRTNVLCVPIQSVTVRLPKPAAPSAQGSADKEPESDESRRKKLRDQLKAEEIVFRVENNVCRRMPVQRGISDQDYVEIITGVSEGQEIISGGYKAINRELDDGKRVKIEVPQAHAAGRDPKS